MSFLAQLLARVLGPFVVLIISGLLLAPAMGQPSTVYVNDPGNIMGVGALLDHLLAEERFRNTTTRTNDDDGVPDADEPFLEEPGRWQ